MTVTDAAEVIGCTATHVRWLIRNGKLKARKVKSRNNQHGYEYLLRMRDVRHITTRRRSA